MESWQNGKLTKRKVDKKVRASWKNANRRNVKSEKCQVVEMTSRQNGLAPNIISRLTKFGKSN